MRSLLLLIALVPAMASAATAPLQNPMTGKLPKHMSLQDAERTIKLALLDLGWLIRKSEPGAMTADIDVRGRHQVVVSIKYNENSLQVGYVDSVNMDYGPCPSSKKAGAMCIHEHYHGWIENMFTALTNAMQKLELFGVVPSAAIAAPASPPAPPVGSSTPPAGTPGAASGT